MKYYIDNPFVGLKSVDPKVLHNKANRIMVYNPNKDRFYLDILDKTNELFWKIRLFRHARVLNKQSNSLEPKLQVDEMFLSVKPSFEIKIEGIHEMYDGRFNVSQPVVPTVTGNDHGPEAK